MSARDPQSLLLEVEYVQLLLDDLRELNSAAARLAEPLVAIPLELLALLIPTPCNVAETTQRVSGHVSSGLDLVRETQAVLGRMVELLTGRGVTLRAELEELRS